MRYVDQSVCEGEGWMEGEPAVFKGLIGPDYG